LIRAVGESAGATIYELAWARDYRSIVLNEPEKSIGAEETFSSDLDNQEEILGELLRVTDRATRRLRDEQFMARTISIKVRFGDFTTITRSKTLPLPISSTQEIYSQAKALYVALNLERARVRLVGIRLEGLLALKGQPLAAQPELGARDKGWSEVEVAIDAARDRFGGEAVAPARLLKPPDLPGSG
jgi:DNA polymerase-4